MDRLRVLLVVAGWAGLATGAVCCEAAGVGLAVAGINAQDGQDTEGAEDDEMMAQIMVLAIERDDAEMYAHLMGLDEMQREVAHELHREYLGKYREAATAIRDGMEKMEEMFMETDEEKVAAVMKDFAKIIMGFYERTVTLADQYVSDLGALAFDDTQKAGHERVVRARVRHEAIGLLSSNGNGNVIDLLSLSQRLDEPLDLSASEDSGTDAARALLAYERELHATCERAIAASIESIRVQFEAMGNMDDESGWEASSKIEEQLTEMASDLQAVTERYSRRVQQSLSPELSTEWERAIREARYPQVYAAGDFERAVGVVLGLEDLTADQRESVEATRNAWEREAETANTRWVGAITKHEELMRNWPDGDDPEVFQKHWENYQKAEQESTAAATARSELDERFIDRLRKILTPEQQEKLPKTESGVDVDEVLRQMGGG